MSFNKQIVDCAWTEWNIIIIINKVDNTGTLYV